MYLQSAEIQNFHGIRNLSIDFEKDTSVLIGENAWGKSSLLCALSMVLGQGSDSLCTFSKDDLYIPIKINSEENIDDDNKDPDCHNQIKDNKSLNTDNVNKVCADSSSDKSLAIPFAHDLISCREYLHNKGLDEFEPIKVINNSNYLRHYYSVPNPNGAGRVLHIVDFPCEKHRPLTDRWGQPSKNSSKNKKNNTHVPNRRISKNDKRHSNFSNALDSFIASRNKQNNNEAQATLESNNGNTASQDLSKLASLNANISKLKSKHNVKKSILNELMKGLYDEAQYEKEQPLYYKTSSQERVARAKSTLEHPDELNVEGLTSVQEDIKFFSSDIYKDRAESIVIDLIFCQAIFGELVKIPRFKHFINVCYTGNDGRSYIHYRVQASFSQTEKGLEFITTHKLLDKTKQPIDNCEPYIKDLILLNPLLRLRDRRMYKLPQDNQNYNDESKRTLIYKGDESEAYQAISHFFANIDTEEDLNSSSMQNSIEVLNTIASKYLTNYHSNYTSKELSEKFSRPRTAREIISHPVSIESLDTLKDAIANEKPSRSKLLLSLLAGALLMSKGQREIDEYSRPILILEDIESRFHPTLLLNLWSILQVLPIQKIVTTNSSQLLSAISLNNLRRLCKQYYDVRCYRIKDKAFNVDDERKIAFHIRMSRPSALFARYWILVEGETEVWLLNEIASVLGINLASSGIKLLEFAQCGLYPIIRLARQMGISYHVLTDGDDAGRHYAAAVRDFVGSHNLPDYLSVMPHLDIEHYLYTSGFADVYQKAANLEIKTFSPNHVPNYLANVLIKELESEPETAQKLKQHLANNSCILPNEPQIVAEQTQDTLELASEQLNMDKFTLKNHNLDSVIKSLLSINFNNCSDDLNKILARGKFKGKSSKAKQFTLKELSKSDACKLNQYLIDIVNAMPQGRNGRTKKQIYMLNMIKDLNTALLDQVNKNNQRLEQLKKNALAKLKKSYQEQKNFTPISTMSLDEQNKSLQKLKSLAAQAIVTESDFINAKNFERSTGKTTNAIYGALNEQELSKLGLSINKVISLAIHKKTKPGLAILIGEAMQQRGEDSVPLLFRTMFRKIKRISHNDIAFY